VQSSTERSNSLNSGHRACQGCGEALGARYAVDAAMRATNNQLIAANATGCLEVFSTPYPETSWQLPWIHSLFGNAAAVGTGIAAALKIKAVKAGQWDANPLRAISDVRVIAQGGDGGTTDIGFGCLSRHVRAQRRRAVHLLRQRGLHEHRRAAQQRHAAGRAHRHHHGRGQRAGCGVRPGQEPAADRDGARDPLRGHRHRGRPARPGSQGRKGDEPARRALPAHPGALPAGLGRGQPRHHQAGAAGARDRHLPGLRGRTRRGHQRHQDPPPRAGGRIPAAAEALCPPLSGAKGHPEMLARIQADADRNIRRFKLLDEEVAA
jgi:pyruvate ferredoxin oxidoreductase beta subunit